MLPRNPAAEIIEMSSNPQTHRVVCESLMQTPHPTKIKQVVDRVKYPLGRHRAQELIRNSAEAAGWKFVKGAYDDV